MTVRETVKHQYYLEVTYAVLLLVPSDSAPPGDVMSLTSPAGANNQSVALLSTRFSLTHRPKTPSVYPNVMIFVLRYP